MALLSKFVRKIAQEKLNRWRVEAASASFSTIGLLFSVLLMPASAVESDGGAELNGHSPEKLTRLQVLQLGARRAQLDRILRSQTVSAPASDSAPDRDAVSANGASTSSSSTHSFSTHSFSTGDGVYLYGQYPVYDQPATAYFVFERKADFIEGAFYTPSSSFDCAQGRVNSEDIQLTITNSYSRESYGYALGIAPATTQTASGQSVTLPQRIRGYYTLPVRENDRAILASCQVQ